MRDERILITGARAPAALHLARLLHGAGCFVALGDSLRAAVSFASTACDAAVVLPSATGGAAAYGDGLAQAITQHRITHVVPTCEEVFHLAGVWGTRDMGARLFAPGLDRLARVHNKWQFIEIARGLDLPVPETRLLQTIDDLAAVQDRSTSLVFKPVWSRFGTDVQICPKTPKLTPSARFPWVAQNHVAGTLVSAYAVAHRGRVTALAAYHPLYRAGQGAGTAFAPVSDPAISDFIARFVAGTEWTGQISFDFIKDGAALMVIECNPRATSGIHLFTEPHSFAGAFFGGGAVKPDASGLHAVKLAMIIYGWWPALRSGTFGRYLQDLRSVNDVMVWPGDVAPRRQQWRAVAEIAQIALRRRVSLQTAATDDIEWDGPD